MKRRLQNRQLNIYKNQQQQQQQKQQESTINNSNDDIVKCRVKIEMKERLLGEQTPPVVEPTVPRATPVPKQPSTNLSTTMDQQALLPNQQQQHPVATIVRLNPDGYGSHTSPTRTRPDRTPLVPKQPTDDFHVIETKTYPKNAKTSLFIIMSFVYAKLLIVICVAYVISDVITHNIPLFYYEGFFTYLYGMSIFFLLYVFCFLLQESSCCSGNEKEKKVKAQPKRKSKEKDVERKKEELKKKKEEIEQKKKEMKEKKKEKEKEKEKEKKNKKQDKQKASSSGTKPAGSRDPDFNISFSFEDIKREKFPRKMRDLVRAKAEITRPTLRKKSTTYRRNSQGVVDAEDVVPVPVAEISERGHPAHLRHSSQGPQQEAAVVQQGGGGGVVPPPPVPPPTTLPIAVGGATATVQINNVDVESGIGGGGGGSNAGTLAAQLAVTQQKSKCKRKTTQNDQSHGSFFLRIGAIAFGLGTMIYNGLEFGTFFEVPFDSPCYMVLRGINPVLQMIFTFMQMYFIFMNSRLNIHRFKVIARFGLMHVAATNLCVWIRTLVLEYIKEITVYHQNLFNIVGPTNSSLFAESVKQHTLRNANTIMGSHLSKPDVGGATPLPTSTSTTAAGGGAAISTASTTIRSLLSSTARNAYPYLNDMMTTTTTNMNWPPTTMPPPTRNAFSTAKTIPTTFWKMYKNGMNTFNFPTTSTTTSATTLSTVTTTTTAATTTIPTTAKIFTTLPTRMWNFFERTMPTAISTARRTTSTALPSSISPIKNYFDFNNFNNLLFSNNNVADEPEEITETISNSLAVNSTETLEAITPQALINYFTGNFTSSSNDSCGRINIMGNIVQDSAPYLFPFIIEYSLIGAAVIYVMWKHIGRNPKYVTQEDLEHRLEIMLSRRAVAMAQAQQGRVDCVGASKGLFFGLLMLVASLICLILFFVLVNHKDLNLLAIFLADISHCTLMLLSIMAIGIGFIRVQHLKFKTEEQSDLNDILLRVSAFGLFTYAVFSVIAGHLSTITGEIPNLMVMFTGIVAVFQVVVQLLFIADVSRRRVHLPEHDRTKPGRQVVTFLLICNVTMWIIYTFEAQKVEANPVQKQFYGFLSWAMIQRVTLPLCIFHRFHSAVTLAEIWKTSYKTRLE